MPVVGLGLLLEGQPSRDLALDVDRERRTVTAKPLAQLVGVARIAHHSRIPSA